MYSRRDNLEEETKKPNELDTFFRSMGTDSFSSLSRPSDKLCYYWPDPRWPILPPSVQAHKCDKCTREKRTQEYYSLVNCRRHTRSHRKTFQTDKEALTRNRTMIANFWDQLSLASAHNILSVSGTTIDILTGSKTSQALMTFLQSPLTYVPHAYFRTGSDIDSIQKKARNNVRISSDELFSVLDDASEKTFLSGGTSEAVVRYIYQADGAKIIDEDKNAMAFFAFLVEDKLVKAWNAEKGAAALRFQAALVAEEEAAQKKREKILEKKRLKKHRQKERKGLAGYPVPNADDDLSAVEELAHVAASSEGSDQVDTDKSSCTEKWGEEVDTEKLRENSQDFTEKSLSRPVNGSTEHASFPKRQRPKFQKPGKAATNGYSVWARKTKRVSVCDASTDIDSKTNEDEKMVELPDLNELPEYETAGNEPVSTSEATDEFEQQNKHEAEISEERESQYNDGERQKKDEAQISDQLVCAGADDDDDDVLVIGSVSVPWTSKPLPLLAAGERNAKESEPIMDAQGTEAAMDKKWRQEEEWRQFLSARWAEAVADTEAVFAGTLMETIDSEEAEAAEAEAEAAAASKVEEGIKDVGVAEEGDGNGGDKGVGDGSSSSSNVLGQEETSADDEKPIVLVRNGSYMKRTASARWQKSRKQGPAP